MVEIVTMVMISPRRVWVETDITGTVHIKMQHEGGAEFDFIQIQYDPRYTCNSMQTQLTEHIMQLLGASTTA